MIIKKFEEFHLINEKRSDKIKRIIGLKPTIFKHCVKLYLYPNTEYINHWTKEIRSRLAEVYELNDGKQYDTDVYHSCLIGTIDFYDDQGYAIYHKMFNDVITEYTIEPIQDDFKTCLKLYVKFIDSVINNILTTKEFDEDIIFELLSEIFEIQD